MSKIEKAIEEPLKSLSMTIPFSCRDLAAEKRDAWVWGIVCGWDDDCFPEFQRKFGWNKETFERLKRLHARFEALQEKQEREKGCGIIYHNRHLGGYKYVTCQKCKETIEVEHPVELDAPYCGNCGKVILNISQPYCGWCGRKLGENNG